MKCDWPDSYLHITDSLMRDQAKVSRSRERYMIRQAIQEQLARNTTRTMTFTDDGLRLALKIIDAID